MAGVFDGLFRGRRAEAGSEPADMKAFARDLFRHGVYVLPCGGGIVAEPRRAIRELRPRYGEDGLRQLAMELYFQTPQEPPTAAWAVAYEILYHLATPGLFQRLLALRGEREAALADAEPDARRRELGALESLIAGVAGRLGLPLPDGIEPLDPQMEHALFWDEAS